MNYFAHAYPFLDDPYFAVGTGVPGCTIGYEHTFINSFADFLASLERGQPFRPDMKSALRTQQVCDTVLQSAREGKWLEIP